MNRYHLKNWWILTIKGLATFGFALTATWISIYSLPTLISICGILLLISGAFMIVSSILQKLRGDRTWILTEGFLDIMVGTILLSFHELSAGMFISMIAIWISFIGIIQIANKYRLNSLFNHWGFLLFNGFMAIIFAFFVLHFPLEGMITRSILIGLQTGIMIGFLIVSSCHVKKLLSDIQIDIPHKEGEEGNQELTYF
jgi:uncharacterized membrane protein HdeD (DUF308 family)